MTYNPFSDSGEEGVVEQLHKQIFLERENVSELRQQNEKAEKVLLWLQ